MIGGLSNEDLRVIKEACAQFAEVNEALLFGSRAKGNYEHGSDVDIALKGENLERATSRIAGYLNDESPLPYHFDVLDYHTASWRYLRNYLFLHY